jgi:hypothetical protein
MKEINLPSGNYLFVEVPDDAYDFSNNLHSAQIDFLQDTPYKDSSIVIKDAVILRDYYHDKFEIISTTKDITEEQAESIVDKIVGPSNKSVIDNYYKSYDVIKEYKPYRTFYKENDYFKTAKESLQSLIQANGLDINKNYLILRMI